MKTLSDDDAPRLVLDQVVRTTIAGLNHLPNHCIGSTERRSWTEEFRVYEVIGIVKHVRSEDDRDIHIVLEDSEQPQFTVITEVVDPQCSGAADSPHVLVLRKVRTALSALLRSGKLDDPGPLLGRKVRVRGLGFYDFDHGQTGRSKNCIELHPVLEIEGLSDPTPLTRP